MEQARGATQALSKVKLQDHFPMPGPRGGEEDPDELDEEERGESGGRPLVTTTS